MHSIGNFRRWLGHSQVVDGAGKPRAVYHATRSAFGTFEPRRGVDSGFHFGTLAQARMRGGRVLLEVNLSAQGMKRVPDHCRWTREQISAARRQATMA